MNENIGVRHFGGGELGGAVGALLLVASGCGPGASPAQGSAESVSRVYSVALQAGTVSGLPACTAALPGTTAFVTAPPTLYSCNGSKWSVIACTKELAGSVAYLTTDGSLWACSALAWTKVAA